MKLYSEVLGVWGFNMNWGGHKWAYKTFQSHSLFHDVGFCAQLLKTPSRPRAPTTGTTLLGHSIFQTDWAAKFPSYRTQNRLFFPSLESYLGHSNSLIYRASQRKAASLHQNERQEQGKHHRSDYTYPIFEPFNLRESIIQMMAIFCLSN